MAYLALCDRQRSSLGMAAVSRAYSPYGLTAGASDSLLGYCGQPMDPMMATYFLGNGHRLYSPRLMRLYSPDRLSPFAAGGINGYAYCSGDPINRHDPSGQDWSLIKDLAIGIFSFWKSAETNYKRFEKGAKLAEKKRLNPHDMKIQQEPGPSVLVTTLNWTAQVGGGYTIGLVVLKMLGITITPEVMNIMSSATGLQAVLAYVAARRENRMRKDKTSDNIARQIGSLEHDAAVIAIFLHTRAAINAGGAEPAWQNGPGVFHASSIDETDYRTWSHSQAQS